MEFTNVFLRDIFDIEYWSLEQANLPVILSRHVVAVTGGASGIGAATAAAFAVEGRVFILDRDLPAAQISGCRMVALALSAMLRVLHQSNEHLRICRSSGGLIY